MERSPELFELLTQCRTAGLSLSVTTEGNLFIEPREKLTDAIRSELRANKAAVIWAISPRVENGDLVIPIFASPRFRYWQGGQPIADTLRELNAPPELFARHTLMDLSHLIEPVETMRQRWQALHGGTFVKPVTTAKGKKK